MCEETETGLKLRAKDKVDIWERAKSSSELVFIVTTAVINNLIPNFTSTEAWVSELKIIQM